MPHSYSSFASQVGSRFVQQYYDVLRHQPEFVKHYYSGCSTMIRVDGESTVTASAMSQIHELVEKLNFSEIKIKTINSVGPWNEGINVVVSGSVKSDNFSGWRNFIEMFSLAQQDKDCTVINNIFHFVGKEDLSGLVYAKNPIDIHYIKREDTETVEDFLFRFTKETSQIPRANDSMKISGFIHGVRNDELVEKLHENIPKTFKDMINRVKGFVRGKKARKTADESSHRPTKKVRHNPNGCIDTDDCKYDPNEYCEYHEDFGHCTDECVILKARFEDALETGEFDLFMKDIKKLKGKNNESGDKDSNKKVARTLFSKDTKEIGGVDRGSSV
ncbi:uncharacterized protein LOC143594382 [Bidens hawaiensis]|uniref:uncharacterized protein LOC143594382 n=1 Tax=Bidens hawaiensis TaxID=980011 RepID=UPI00404A5F51